MPRDPKRNGERKARIYFIRKSKDLSLKQFAMKVGVHFVTLSRLENYRIVPSHDLAEKVGKVTKQSTGQVIDEYLKYFTEAA